MPATSHAALGRNGRFGRSARQQSDEFFTTRATDNIGCAERFAHDLRKELKHRVAGRMPTLVVDRFEAIEVKTSTLTGAMRYRRRIAMRLPAASRNPRRFNSPVSGSVAAAIL